MAWLDVAIATLQEVSHDLTQLKHLAILCFMVGVQALIPVAFVVWATGKLWSLAKVLLALNVA